MPEGLHIYLDNAATTRTDPRVANAMLPFLDAAYGNPSSVHAFGRESRSAIEKARKKIAALLNAQPSEVYFTSGGTEADNLAIYSSIRSQGIRQVISSPLEHHAVLHPLQELDKMGSIELRLLETDAKGNLNFDQLRFWMEKQPFSLVSLMQANNEIGNLNPVGELASEVKERGGFFHSDTVQTMGKLPLDFRQLKADFLVASAHKFHGPKGVGFAVISSDLKIPPLISGGSQERNMRGGTENLMGIVGMAEALEFAVSEMKETENHVSFLKNLFKSIIETEIEGVQFNGLSGEKGSLFSILNVSLPPSSHGEMLLANLDIRGVAVSGGSACSSGSDIGSHVLRALNADPARPAVRFSFGKFNTEEEVRKAAAILCSLYQ